MTLHGRIRIASAIAIAGAAGMTILGAVWTGLRQAPLVFITYWAVVVILLAIAVYLAFLDMRIVRLRYRVQERQALRDVLGVPDHGPHPPSEEQGPGQGGGDTSS
jgi:apolipoprotein N-acyltransferase